MTPTSRVVARVQLQHAARVVRKLTVPNDEPRPWGLIAWGVVGVVACGCLCWWLS